MWGVLGFLAKLGTKVLDLFWPSKDRELGRAEAQKEGLDANVDDLKKADAAVRRVRRDPAYRERLRQRARKARGGS
jgi:hypothetical protein